MGEKLRRGWCLGVLVTLVLVAACSSDDKKTATTNSSTSSSSSSSASASTSSSSSSAAGSAAIEKLAGDYQGTWKNTTFGSTGGATATVKVDAAAKTVSVNYDLAGSVFGASDPPAEELKGTIDADGGATASTTSTLFGPITVTYKPSGAFEMKAASVPSTRIASFSMTGNVAHAEFTLNYEVVFKDGSKAQGTLTMKPA